MREDMIINRYSQVKIAGIAAAVSSHWQSVEEAAECCGVEEDFNIEKFKKNTGVRGRYLAGNYQTTSDFCYAAGEALLQHFGIDRKQVGVLVFVSQMPDYENPATACVLHKRLKLAQNCIAFDINQGCAGFVYGLNATAALLQSGNFRYALMLCGDTSAKDKSRGREENKGSHSTLLLFGDGGTATLLEKSNSSPLLFTSCTDGENFDAIMISDHSWRHPWSCRPRFIDDVRVFNFSINKAPEMLKDYMELMNSTPQDYDKLVLHQANMLIMKTVAKRAGFSLDKMLSSIEIFANTSSASIPNTIVNGYGEDCSLDILRFLCCGFGVGLSWAAVELRLSPSQILPLIHTDEWFDDGLPEE
jgi:3-oxoacyl-[acyl-carrier-protein] synthase III